MKTQKELINEADNLKYDDARWRWFLENGCEPEMGELVINSSEIGIKFMRDGWQKWVMFEYSCNSPALCSMLDAVNVKYTLD
jgi:hypothetical protein